MATNRPTGDLVEIITQQAKDIRKLKARVFSGGGYRSGKVIHYTADGTFDKADFPGLKAVRVKVQAGGAGADGADATGSGEISASPGGGGGGYAETYAIPISDLAASETITVGAGGAANSAGNDSSFGSHVEAEGGQVGGPTLASTDGTIAMEGGEGGAGVSGDLLIGGGPGGPAIAVGPASNEAVGGNGGDSVLGGGGRGHRSVSTQPASTPPTGYGSGAGGRANRENQSAVSGQAGADGIVIVELLY